MLTHRRREALHLIRNLFSWEGGGTRLDRPSSGEGVVYVLTRSGEHSVGLLVSFADASLLSSTQSRVRTYLEASCIMAHT